MQQHRYGHFSPDGRVFTITDPATPMPWVNVICHGGYGVAISQRGGGFSWVDDAQHNVLTRWDMDLVRDVSGKHLYLHDRDTKKTWSLAPAPTNPRYDAYRCEHTQGSTTFHTSLDGIAATWAIGVSPSDPLELWLVTLHNTSDRPRRLRLASSLAWCCGVAPDSKREFHRLFLSTRHDSARRAIYASKSLWDIPPKREQDRWNVAWPSVALHALCGGAWEHDLAFGDRSMFLGRYGSEHAPLALHDAKARVAGFGRGRDACAALGGDLTLLPGQSVSFHYLLGVASTESKAAALIDRYTDPNAARQAFVASEATWAARLGELRVQSSREDIDLLLNHWLGYQAISGRLWGRTGYYQQSGARGFRDQLQDSQVMLAYEPRRCLEQVQLHAGRQRRDGSVDHWWHELADFGNPTSCSDDYLWLPAVAAAYARETGDLESLERTKAPYLDDAEKRSASMYEHCQQSLRRACDRLSPRGLPLMGACDWNDGLSAMGCNGKGESVWVAMFLAGLLREWGLICERVGDAAIAAEYAQRREQLIAAVHQHAWDGAWYRYGTRDDGSWVGSSANPEGKIHLNVQTWAILADVAPADRAMQAWQSVREHLLSPIGPLLLTPAYSTPDAGLGYITRYSPGSRENGGVYMHAATWALAAAAKLGDLASVEQIWNSISPPRRGQEGDAYAAEPYVTPGNVDGPASETPGRAGWTWYTGSAAWMHRVLLEQVLGIRPTWDGLAIAPLPLRMLGDTTVTRRWRGVPIHVRTRAPLALALDERRVCIVQVEGREVEHGIIPPQMLREAGGAGLHVDVTWRVVPSSHLPPSNGCRVHPAPPSAPQQATRRHP